SSASSITTESKNREGLKTSLFDKSLKCNAAQTPFSRSIMTVTVDNVSRLLLSNLTNCQKPNTATSFSFETHITTTTDLFFCVLISLVNELCLVRLPYYLSLHVLMFSVVFLVPLILWSTGFNHANSPWSVHPT